MCKIYKINQNKINLMCNSKVDYEDFSPYVSSINNNSVLSFQATLKEGKSGIYISEKNKVNCIIKTDNKFKEFFSHPDINNAKNITFYANKHDGEEGVYLSKNNEIYTIFSVIKNELNYIGPLGPTINEKNLVSFRATYNGIEAIYYGSINKSILIADNKDFFKSFHGLPVINDNNEIAFRTTLKNNREAIYLHKNNENICLVDTTNNFSSISSFISLNNFGEVIFAGKLKNGEENIFIYKNGNIEALFYNKMFDSFRGALINNNRNIIFYATTKNEGLGVFAYNNNEIIKIISFEEKLFNAPVIDFALNPVSLNDKGEIVLRIKDSNNIHSIISVNNIF
ncbi:MAG: choice-of-anchor tandem repeat NxxGxxAF-containing protein [Candidatus Sericytochromatia bacterium]